MALVSVDLREVVEVSDLLGDEPVASVFSPAERRHCGSFDAVPRWAGRLAAKQAVLALVDPGASSAARLRSVEVDALPDGRCSDPDLCRAGHRPVARYVPTGQLYALSISHERHRAVAIATRGVGGRR